ncbi:MAG TPA: hypothetical protein VFX85_03015 [Solirubrobacterales bacterium]|nr:hypothetical protein [Solirubrobacterales bacterium]
MKSFKSFDGSLFPPASDDEWLALVDTGYEYGIEIAAPLSGSRSQGARAATFLGYYLTESSQRRSQCVVKLGRADAIQREYEGWQNFARHQPNRNSFASMSPPLLASVGAVVVTDFVGSAEAPMEALTVAQSKGWGFLVDAFELLVNGTLAPLHEFRRAGNGSIPELQATQAEILDGWLTPPVRSAAAEKLDDSLADTWRQRIVAVSGGAEIPGLIPDLLEGHGLGGDDSTVRLPLGAVHGDPNFDNVFVAHISDGIANLALIDFEWCRCGERDSPYEDLARLECEVLFGQELDSRDELTAALVFGDTWLREGRPLAAGKEPGQSVFASARVLRRQAAALAGPRSESAELEFQRGYLATLLGQAIRYVIYDTPRSDSRAEALSLCQMLAARLARPLTEPAVRAFRAIPIPLGRKGGRVVTGPRGHVLSARSAGAYASLVLGEVGPVDDFVTTCEFEVEAMDESGWLALSLGVEPNAPEHTGLSARLRSDGANRGSTIIYSHRSSKHSGAPDSFSVPWGEVSRLTLELSVDGKSLSLATRTAEAEEELSFTRLVIPAEEYQGPLALIAYSAEILVRSLEVRLECP